MYFYRPGEMTPCGKVVNYDFKSLHISAQVISAFLYTYYPVLLCYVEPAIVIIDTMRIIEFVNTIIWEFLRLH